METRVKAHRHRKGFLLAWVVTLSMLTPVPCNPVQEVSLTVLFSSNLPAYAEAWKGFNEHLRENNIVLNVTQLDLADGQQSVSGASISRGNPRMVMSLGTKASRLARDHVKEIPHISCMVFSPDDISGPQATGVTMQIPIETKLRGIKRALPGVRRIGMLYSPRTASVQRQAQIKCDEMGLILVAERVESEKDLPGALSGMIRRTDCFLMIADPSIYSPASVKHLLSRGVEARLPVIGLSSHYTEAGALLSFDCDFTDLGRQAGEIAGRILKGEKAGTIHPASPRKIRLSINKAAAQRLGIEISGSVLREADEVIGR
ncbi:MAG: ABC transporter substrate-binding protein [Candidatus Eisenbacteria bacterium]